MQDVPSVMAKPHWLTTLLIILTITCASVFALVIVTDDEGETGCGGG